MTLDDLLSIGGIMIQGNVRLSVWKDGEETMVKEIKGTDNLNGERIKKYRDMQVLYIFSAFDGFLHIELNDEEE